MESQAKSKSSSPTIFKMGKYTFEYPAGHAKKKPIHKEAIKIIKMDNSDTLDISWGKYKRYKWDNVLKYVKKIDIERISAQGNSEKRILNTLSRISFQNLNHLDLGDSQIESIEKLPAGPHLNYLSLINNLISSVKPLTKFHYPALKTLLLNDNPIKNLEIDRCDFKLETYWLERKYNYKTIQECIGQTCLFKLKNDEIKGLSIESKGRIYQPKLIAKIQQNFPNLEKLFYSEPEDLFQSDVEFVVYMTDEEDDEDNVEDVPNDGWIPIQQAEAPENVQVNLVEEEQHEHWVQIGESEKEGQIEADDINGMSEESSDEMEESSSAKSSCESDSCWDSDLEEKKEQKDEKQHPQLASANQQ